MCDGTLNKHEMLESVKVLLSSVTVKGEESVNALSQAFQMIYALQRGLKDEDNAKNKIIETLKEQLRRATEHIPEDGEVKTGGEQYNFDFGGADNGKN
jgi:hypothetical protein